MSGGFKRVFEHDTATCTPELLAHHRGTSPECDICRAHAALGLTPGQRTSLQFSQSQSQHPNTEDGAEGVGARAPATR